jgi:hypothetical protein
MSTNIEWTRNDDGTAGKVWNPIPTHPGYSASTCGEIRGPRGKILKPMRADSGHLYVLTPRPRSPRKLFVHRAVLLAHVGPPPSPAHEGRHGDGNPENNALTNLCWGTRLENMHDKARHGTELHGEAKPAARLTVAKVRAIRNDRRPARVVGAEYGVSHTAILRIRRGERWRAA